MSRLRHETYKKNNNIKLLEMKTIMPGVRNRLPENNSRLDITVEKIAKLKDIILEIKTI